MMTWGQAIDMIDDIIGDELSNGIISDEEYHAALCVIEFVRTQTRLNGVMDEQVPPMEEDDG